MAKLIARALRANNGQMEVYLVLLDEAGSAFSIVREHLDRTAPSRLEATDITYVPRIRKLQLFGRDSQDQGSDPQFFTPCWPHHRDSPAPQPQIQLTDYLLDASQGGDSFFHLFHAGGKQFFAFRCQLREFLLGNEQGQVHSPELPGDPELGSAGTSPPDFPAGPPEPVPQTHGKTGSARFRNHKRQPFTRHSVG